MLLEEISRTREEMIKYQMGKGIWNVEPLVLRLHPITYEKLKADCTKDVYRGVTGIDYCMGMRIKIDRRLNPNIIRVEDNDNNIIQNRLLDRYSGGHHRPLDDDSLDAIRYCEEDIEMAKNNMYPSLFSYGWLKPVTILPKRYIVNKDACILFWDDNGKDKVVVKRCKDDSVDPIKAFLWAYFEKTSGLSKTKANRYLQKVEADYLENN